MGYYLGHFYIDKRDLFIVFAVILLFLGNYLHYPLPYFEYRNLIILAILFLFAKGFLLTAYDSVLFAVFLTAIILTLFFPLLQVLYFLSLSFIFLRLFKVI